MANMYDQYLYKPTNKDQLGLGIGSLISAALASTGGNNTREALIRAAAGGLAGYGSGWKGMQDQYGEVFRRAMEDRQLRNQEQSMAIRNALGIENQGLRREQFEANKNAGKYKEGKQQSGMGRMNEYTAFQGMTPEDQSSYLEYLGKTGYNRVLGMNEAGEPIFAPTRGNVQLKTPIASPRMAVTQKPPVSGKDIQPFVRPTIPTEATKDIADFKTLLDLSKQVKDTYDPSYSGAIQGRYSKFRENWTGGLSDEQLKFNQELESIKNRLIYLRTGKQINEQEFKRMMEELPDVRLPDNTAKVRLDNFYKMSEDLYNNRMKAFSGAGYRNVDNVEQGVSAGQSSQVVPQSTSKESVLQELFDLAQKGDPEAFQYFKSKGIK